MGLYVIGDLHLSFTSDKPMDVFGKKWEGYVEKLNNGFKNLCDDDLTVICGDVSWGIGRDDCLEDFRFIDSLPGRKIILKGNHDYWWSTMSKNNGFLTENSFSTISFLHNNSYSYDGVSICGTRGWMEGELDKSILPREIGRLKASLDSAEDKEKFLFLHYPPCEEFVEIIGQYGIRHCYYGHIHSEGIRQAFCGWRGGCEYKLISADALDFKPLNIH